MLSVDYSTLKSLSAETAPSTQTVFRLETERLGNGQSAAQIFIRKIGNSYVVDKTSHFSANCPVIAASTNSARFVQMPARR